MLTGTESRPAEREQVLADSVVVIGLVLLAAILVVFVIGDGLPSVLTHVGGLLTASGE
jgi:hypothetical protein